MRSEMTPETALRQASMTAEEYMNKAVQAIDKTFKNGYAGSNPDLVAAFMNVAVQDFHSASLSGAIYALADAISKKKL